MAVKLVIRDLRIQKKLTQQELAEKTGYSTSFIARIEQNKVSRFNAELLDVLCEVLECEIKDILIREDDL